MKATTPIRLVNEPAYARFLTGLLSLGNGEARWICRLCKTHYLTPRADCDWCAPSGTVETP